MINDHTLGRFEALGPKLLKPIYDDYSFANLPATLHYLLTGETIGPLLPADCFGGTYPKPRMVVLFFIDSFGWQFWQRYGHTSRLMRAVIERGTLTPISALFPSTTAASVSTLNLGCLPARHGVYEWNMYVPAYGETIQSLPFATLGRKPVSGVTRGWDVRDMVIEHATMHQRLARHGVRSIQLAHRAYAHSPYNSVTSAGAEVIAHATLPEALVQLKRVLAATTGKALINLYWAGLDTSAHSFGPGSPEHVAEVTAFWATMDALLADLDSPDTLFLFTADHGHVRGNAADTIYINERWPECAGWLSVSPTGQTIWPNGSPRDMFLHVQEAYRERLHCLLTVGLAGAASVMTVDAALASGLFGREAVSAELRRRLGDILVLPHLGHFVWWREPGIMDNTLHGHHGGLSAEELITVLGVVGGAG
jgi:Type I phosphodiesterase / nucleotide pyrophosphatase